MNVEPVSNEYDVALQASPQHLVALGIAGSGRGLRIRSDKSDALCLLDPVRCHSAIVGPPDGLLLEALVRGAPRSPIVFAAGETAACIASLRPEWSSEPVYLHQGASPLPEVPCNPDSPITLSITEAPAPLDLDHMPVELHQPLRLALQSQPVAVAYDAGLPVSFCYAFWQGGGMWDVSVDTHPSHRRRGLARATVSRLIEYQRLRGLEPCWGVPASDPRGRSLVASLGFAKTHELTVFSMSGATGFESVD